MQAKSKKAAGMLLSVVDVFDGYMYTARAKRELSMSVDMSAGRTAS